MTHLLRDFLLYCVILVRITRLEVQQSLTFALLEYCDRLLAGTLDPGLHQIVPLHLPQQENSNRCDGSHGLGHK